VNQFGKFAEKIGILVQGGTVNVGQIRLDGEMSRQELRNRKALLNNVRTAWVEGVLEKSLHEQIPIVIGLENRPNAVASPWNLDLINPDQSCQPLPAGTPVIDVFDKLGEGGTLLILGEPGSGKTITLLQLARDLIARAEEEIDRRIPVVLNLSSWAAEKQTIAKWIVEELNSKYQVNRKIGQQWVEKQELLLLLDGLDEIRDLEKRNACVTALNAFQQEQATEMVVCCRGRDYEELGDHHLKLQSALVLQPLTPNQIQAYLDRLQSDVTAFKIMLAQYETLQELVQSPLLLNIMVLAYNGIEVADIPIIIIDSNPIKQVWDDYIERMFQGSRLFAHLTISKSPEKQTYSRKDTTHWLVWMAKQMIQHSQTIFLIEKMQFSWLKGNIKSLYITLCMNTVFLIERIQLNWIKENSKHLNDIAQLIVSFILLIISIVSLSIGYQFFYPIVNHLASPIIALIPIIGGIYPFLIFISYVFTLGIIQSIFIEEIQPIYSVKSYMTWDKVKFKKILSFILKYVPFVWLCLSVISLIFGMLGMWDKFFVFMLGTWAKNFPRDLIHILLQILYVGLYSYFYCFILGISFFVITDGIKFGLLPIQVDPSVYPNQGIRKSAINAMLIGLIFGIVVSIIYIYLNALNIAINALLINFGLIVVFLSSMLPFGGKASVQHLVLRLILCFNRNIPWNYAKFLDWASDKLFLQKVGGGYIFIHRSLMEHFAEMENG
jgi:hypothetical protein